MDGTTQAAGGFYGWIMQYGQVVAFVAQIVYWLGMLLLLFYAVWQYKRWVNFQLGTGRSGALREGDEAPAASKKSDDTVDIEEFVE